jgi:hypothetical protein
VAYQSGTAGSVVIVTGGTPIVTGVHEWSLDIGQETPEVTAFGDSWKAFLPGIREWSGSFGIRLDPAGTVQDYVRNMLLGGSAAIVFRFATGANYFSGSALVNGGAPEDAYDGAAETSYDVQGTGALSWT